VRHAYPQDLAQFVRDRWSPAGREPEEHGVLAVGPADPLPATPALEELLSICYQASLLREEERPIRFRLLLREPGSFAPAQGPPTGLHRLLFTQPRPLNEHELRRLAPAVDFYRCLLGVRVEPGGGGQIWGVLSSGPRWLQAVQGGRRIFSPLPPAVVVRVTGPGRVAVCQGLATIAALASGRVTDPRMDVFDSRRLLESFAAIRAELLVLHQAARAQAGTPWATLDPEFSRILGQQVVRRLISLMRTLHHGGIILFLPPDAAAECLAAGKYVTLKYTFVEEEPRQRFRTLIVEVMNALAEAYGQEGDPQRVVGWTEYVATHTDEVVRLDEALFEVAHLIASFSAVDGAVVLTKGFEVLGFGGEISGALAAVPTVARALDVEGEQLELESTAGVGTRHRSVYRLCQALHEALAIVVSQDGTVRFVQWRQGAVTYWEQVATSVLDI